MTSFDPDLFARALRRLVGDVERLKAKVEFVEEENGRLRRANDELAGHLRRHVDSHREQVQIKPLADPQIDD